MEERVRAAMRIKGTSANLQVDGCRVTIPARDGKGQLTYVLDRIFDSAAAQSDIFAWVEPAVVDVLRGFNATIMAYGQTGSGKSYTMGTSKGNDGIVPRATAAIFRALSEYEDDSQSVVHCSFMQIYGDKVFDLLSSRSLESLAVREAKKTPDADGGGSRKNTVFVQGLSEYHVASAQDVAELVERGLRSRATRPTEMNSRSSRSHAILQLSVQTESHYQDDAGEQENENDSPLSPPKRRIVLRRAKLQLVDLAGSEKWSAAADSDSALAGELKAINKSLSALGNCFAAVVEKKHVPYRDTTLTRLLQDSLGGGTRAIVVATVDAANLEETASTLAFAQRATKVTARLRLNEVVNDTVLLKKAQREISSLRRQLQQAQSRDTNLSREETGESESSFQRVYAFEQQLSEARSNSDNAERLIGRLYTKLELAEDRESAAVAVATAALARSLLAVSTSKQVKSRDKIQQTEDDVDIYSSANSMQVALSPLQTKKLGSVAADPVTIAVPTALPDKMCLQEKILDLTTDIRFSNDASESATSTVENQEPGLCDRHKIRGCFLCGLQSRGDLEFEKFGSISARGASMDANLSTSACERHGVAMCFLCSLRQDGSSEALVRNDFSSLQLNSPMTHTFSSISSLEAVNKTEQQHSEQLSSSKKNNKNEQFKLESPYGHRRPCRNAGRTSSLYRVTNRRPQHRDTRANETASRRKVRHHPTKLPTQRQRIDKHAAAPRRRV